MIEKTPRTALIRTLGDRLAAHPRIEAMVQKHVRDFTASLRALIPLALEDVASEMSGGETLRVYPRKIPREMKVARDVRLLAAIGGGESISIIAKRERMTERGVRKALRRLSGTVAP